MGLDFGQKRIGVALSDPLGITAQGLTVISYKYPEEALQKLAGLCREYAVERIVTGLPLNMDGSRGTTAREAEAFTARLTSRTGLPSTMVDERLTSKAAERTLIAGNASRKVRKEVKDKLAAVLILETYLAGVSNSD